MEIRELNLTEDTQQGLNKIAAARQMTVEALIKQILENYVQVNSMTLREIAMSIFGPGSSESNIAGSESDSTPSY